jgi:hypothetical protein
MFAMATHVFLSFLWYFASVFRRTLQMFQLFRMYVASTSSGCYKSRSGVAHVVIRMRSGGGASGPRAWSGNASDVWVAPARARAWSACRGGGLPRGRPGASTTVYHVASCVSDMIIYILPPFQIINNLDFSRYFLCFKL